MAQPWRLIQFVKNHVSVLAFSTRRHPTSSSATPSSALRPILPCSRLNPLVRKHLARLTRLASNGLAVLAACRSNKTLTTHVNVGSSFFAMMLLPCVLGAAVSAFSDRCRDSRRALSVCPAVCGPDLWLSQARGKAAVNSSSHRISSCLVFKMIFLDAMIGPVGP
jgi:hypothetical protein